MDFDVPITVDQGRKKLREEFNKNVHVNDMRAIDLLVVKVKYSIKFNLVS